MRTPGSSRGCSIGRTLTNESRRRLALARELWSTSKKARRHVALYRSFGDDRPVADGPLRGMGPCAARVGSSRVPWSEVIRIEASPCARCPNCLREHGPLEACLVGVIAGVLVDREDRAVTPEQIARVDVDQLWDRFGGPAVDWLEDHLRWLEADGEV
ncbi:MAG: hypothetical protein JST59_29485 [Actinobacteria bacterium]|nr:hypothetical protein [Actinomycetota bacterium]